MGVDALGVEGSVGGDARVGVTHSLLDLTLPYLSLLPIESATAHDVDCALADAVCAHRTALFADAFPP